MIQTLQQALDFYGFLGFFWRGVVLGLPVAIALPILHPELFRWLDPKEKAPE